MFSDVPGRSCSCTPPATATQTGESESPSGSYGAAPSPPLPLPVAIGLIDYAMGLPIERDEQFEVDRNVSAYAAAAREHGRIVT